MMTLDPHPPAQRARLSPLSLIALRERLREQHRHAEQQSSFASALNSAGSNGGGISQQPWIGHVPSVREVVDRVSSEHAERKHGSTDVTATAARPRSPVMHDDGAASATLPRGRYVAGPLDQRSHGHHQADSGVHSPAVAPSLAPSELSSDVAASDQSASPVQSRTALFGTRSAASSLADFLRMRKREARVRELYAEYMAGLQVTSQSECIWLQIGFRDGSLAMPCPELDRRT